MSRIGGGAFQGQPHHPVNLRITDLARRSGARFVQQAVQPPLQEALTPFADRLVGLRATVVLGLPAAHSKTMRDRCANACALLGRRAQRSSV
jgi:hypothetical protein